MNSTAICRETKKKKINDFFGLKLDLHRDGIVVQDLFNAQSSEQTAAKSDNENSEDCPSLFLTNFSTGKKIKKQKRKNMIENKYL